SALKTEHRRSLAEAIREKVNRHLKFAHTDWALKGAVIDDLSRALAHVEPEDVVARHAWLFADYWKVREDVSRFRVSAAAALATDDWEEEDADKKVEELREAALVEVRSTKDWDGVLALAEVAVSPDQVGAA